MKTRESRKGAFQKVGECLYRYSSNGVYYARVKFNRKEIRRIADAKKAIAGACRRLGFPGYSHRSFRRMFITRAIERGVDVKTIAEWQGHKDGGKLILDTYSHVNRAHSQRMAQLMNDKPADNVIPMNPVAGENAKLAKNILRTT